MPPRPGKPGPRQPPPKPARPRLAAQAWAAAQRLAAQARAAPPQASRGPGKLAPMPPRPLPSPGPPAFPAEPREAWANPPRPKPGARRPPPLSLGRAWAPCRPAEHHSLRRLPLPSRRAPQPGGPYARPCLGKRRRPTARGRSRLWVCHSPARPQLRPPCPAGPGQLRGTPRPLLSPCLARSPPAFPCVVGTPWWGTHAQAFGTAPPPFGLA